MHGAGRVGHPGGMPRLLTLLAPGILVAATGVGAGDLITASLAGVKVGDAILWAVVAGAVLKFVLNEGLARWQLATGTTLLEGWITHLGSWVQWVFVVYLLLWTYTVAGALVNACGVAGDGLYPLSGDPVRSKFLWGVLHSLAGLALVWRGSFALFERLMAGVVAVMFTTVIATALLLGPNWGAIARGLLVPSLPAGSTAWVLGLLGGVGGTLTMLSYGYWIREEGRTDLSHLGDSRIDLGVAYTLTALFSIAMVTIGSHLPGTEAERARFAAVLAEALVPVLGQAGKWVFLVGFWAAVFSSLLGVWQSVPYLFADFVRLRRRERGRAGRARSAGGSGTPGESEGERASEDPGEGEGKSELRTTRAYRGYLVAIATVPLVTLGQKLEAVQLVYAVLGAFFMPFLALTLLLLNNREDRIGAEARNGLAVNVALVATLLLFAGIGAQKLMKIAG